MAAEKKRPKHPKKEGEEALREVEAHDWRADKRKTGKGYFRLRCPCGDHITRLHLSPSNPNHYKERLEWCRNRECWKEPQDEGEDQR